MVKITIKEAAKKYNCTTNRLYKAAARKALTVYREIGRIYLDDEELQTKFIDVPKPATHCDTCKDQECIIKRH